MAQPAQPSRSIAGQVAVVTGAASGIGRATAALFAAEGAAVVAVDRSAEPLGELEASFRDPARSGSGGENPGLGTLRALALDLVEPGAPDAIVAAARRWFGPIDIVVNAAGVSLPIEVGDAGFDAAWAATFAVNVDAQVRLIRAAIADLSRAGAGRVVNIASTEGLAATAPMAPYTASKHAVVGLTRSLAVELGPVGVTVNCVCPGPINTAMTASVPAEAKARYARRRTALRRYGEPDEVAQMILSLVLPAASFCTGAVLAVDGGLSVRSN